MSAKSLTFFNDSLFHPQPSLIIPSLPFGLSCLLFKPGSLVFTTFAITILLFLLPLCIFVLYCGLQRCRQRRSTSRAATSSHSDSFTYHLVTMELCSVIGSILCCCGIYSNNVLMLVVWYYLYTFVWFGKMFFHLLTCVEHYLAVVHPIAYLSLKKEREVKIRNIITGCIWLICFGFLLNARQSSTITNVCLLILAIVIISFCSLSVLYVLIRPGPGEQGRDRVRVHQSKQRAFYTIVAILGVLMLRCVWNLVWTVSDILNQIRIDECVGILCEIWINLPSSLVLPVLFLQRAGTFACCKNNFK